MPEHYSKEMKTYDMLFHRHSRTTFALAGNLSFKRVGASRRTSLASINTPLNFFCKNFPSVRRPDAGGPRMTIFGAKIRRIQLTNVLITDYSVSFSPSISLLIKSIKYVIGSSGRSTSNDEIHLCRRKKKNSREFLNCLPAIFLSVQTRYNI